MNQVFSVSARSLSGRFAFQGCRSEAALFTGFDFCGLEPR